jgi:hypothetical protein
MESLKDIEVIGGSFDYRKLKVLPHCHDRIMAAFFFCEKLEKHITNQQVELAKWYFRAALSEFKSIFDVIGADMKAAEVKKVWDRSCIKEDLEKQPLVKVLKKARDLALHTVKIRTQSKVFPVITIGDFGYHPRKLAALFLDPISTNEVTISEHHLKWFNKQAARWPAHLLIRHVLFDVSWAINNFLMLQGGKGNILGHSNFPPTKLHVRR